MKKQVTQRYPLLIRAWLIASIVFAIGVPAPSAHSQALPTLRDQAGGTYAGIEVVLQVDSSATPNRIATLTVTATPLRTAPDLTIVWELPDGGTLLGGPATETLGATASGQAVQQQRQVQWSVEGVYTVRAQAVYHPDAATTLSAVGVLFFTVRNEGATVSDVDPRLPVYTPPSAKPTIDKADRAVAAAIWGPNVPQGCFYVTGILTREERQPAANPPRYVDQLGSAVPVHNLLVEMREEDTFSDDSYGYAVTDANGKFEFRFCDDDGVANDELELYYRVCAEVWEGPTRIARIEDTTERELYCYDSGNIDSEGGTVNFDVAVFRLNQQQSQVFNIADSLYWAWKFWNNNLGAGAPFFDRSVTVYWEGGKGNGSFYNAGRTALTIAGDASSTDEWDDSVIMHEWTHFADHQFSCNQNPGGAHTLPGFNNGVNGDKLSWGEGFADYFQSAARTQMPGSSNPNFYIDVSGPTVDLETTSNPASPLNEGAVAGLLWDFLDNTNDGNDTVNHGQGRIQKVFSDPAFQGNAQCNMARFLKVWKDLGFPTDAQTAATVVQNVNIAKPFGAVLAADANVMAAQPQAPAASQATSAATPFDYRWWDQVTMVVDNSSSMAGPPGTPKIDAVKALIREQVNDSTRNPRGTEHNLYSFNANTPLAAVAEGQFFLNQLDPALNGLAATGADTGCPVRALDALGRAAENKYDGQVWVYTDGDAQSGASVEFVRQQLGDRLLRGSVVLLGGCNSPGKLQSNVADAEKEYLSLAADGSQSAGIVPYLLTALGTGGNFLYVPSDQLANATDILRAQLNHSAGAGKWSDYVSTRFTYRWDRLEPSEYQWMPSGLLQDAGQLSSNTPIRINLGQPFSFYDRASSLVDVNEDGYLRMDPCTSSNPQFCPLLSRYTSILEKDLVWAYLFPPPNVAASAAQPTEFGPQVHVYHGGLGINEWYIISTEGIANYGGDFARRAYQVWLNFQTGEVRYLYDAVRSSDAQGAIISVSTQGVAVPNQVVVSNQDLAGAVSGSGYKFTPAPPQPTKSYTVAIDSKVESMVFLQTGYSGSFAPMTVQTPDGTAVNCADANGVKCLSLNGGLVQFVQVDIGGRTGVWTATLGVGATGEGTFSFNALAASALQPKGLIKHNLARQAQIFKLDLGGGTDDGRLTGWLQSSAGARLGDPFLFYDDGQHDDGGAGDGIFTSDAVTPLRKGVAYLWVQGTVAGEAITRSDPTPYNFQPIMVKPEQAEVQGFLGSPAPVVFLVTNQETVQRCYRAEVSAPTGWSATPIADFCVGPQATNGPYTQVSHPLGSEPGGLTGEVRVTFTEISNGSIVGGDAATVRLYRPLAGFAFDNRWRDSYLRPNGVDRVDLAINLLDDQGAISGWTGALGYTLDTTLGAVTGPEDGRFLQGRLPVTFTAGTQVGTALINAVVEGVPVSTTLQIQAPTASALTLTATPTDLSATSASALVATVRDAWGDPVVGQAVWLSVGDDDGSQGTINGSELFTGTADSNGQVIATFTKGATASGAVVVRAETLAVDGRVTQEALVTLQLSASAPPTGSNAVYLPLVQR